MNAGQFWFPGFGWRYASQMVQGSVATAYCYAPGRWVPIGRRQVGTKARPGVSSDIKSLPFAGVAIGQKAVSYSEIELFKFLNRQTYRPGQRSDFELLAKADRLDDVVMFGWCASYLALCNEAGLFKAFAPLFSGTQASAGLANTLSLGLAATGGPGAFIGQWLKNTGALIAGAIGARRTWEARRELHDQISRKIYDVLGPPPSRLDSWFVLWLALERSDHLRGEFQAACDDLFSFSRYFAFGVLGFVGYAFSTRFASKVIPLTKEGIGIIRDRWVQSGTPMYMLDLGYMQEGPYWSVPMQYPSLDPKMKEPVAPHARISNQARKAEVISLLNQFKGGGLSRSWGEISKIADIYRRPLTDIARIDLLKQKTGL